jgi:predicted dehydrogenase
MLENDRLREKPCTHAGAIRQNRDCLLVGGCDIDVQRCRHFFRRYGTKNVSTDFEEMLERSGVDILHIATPAETHWDLVRRALPFEPKVIVCEKPLAGNSDEASMIAEIHSSGKAKVLVNHERRYSRDYCMVREKILQRSFGDLLHISAKLHMGETRPVAETLLHDGTHLIDAVQYLTSSELKMGFVERAAETLLVTSSAKGIPVVMEVGSGRDYVQFEIDLSFSEGRIRIGNGLYEEFRSARSPFYEGMRSLVRTGPRRPRKTGYFRNMLADAVHCCKNAPRNPRSNALDGYSVLRFIDEVKSRGN